MPFWDRRVLLFRRFSTIVRGVPFPKPKVVEVQVKTHCSAPYVFDELRITRHREERRSAGFLWRQAVIKLQSNSHILGQGKTHTMFTRLNDPFSFTISSNLLALSRHTSFSSPSKLCPSTSSGTRIIPPHFLSAVDNASQTKPRVVRVRSRSSNKILLCFLLDAI